MIGTEEEVNGKRKKYRTDTGEVDIFAISKDKKEYLVIELKKGRASEKVVGQIQTYMGFIKEEVAKNNEKVKGLIIALEDDLKIKRALSISPDIEFYRYEIKFDLIKS
jgi:restriction system protein